jgi:hypothetical protein
VTVVLALATYPRFEIVTFALTSVPTVEVSNIAVAPFVTVRVYVAVDTQSRIINE